MKSFRVATLVVVLILSLGVSEVEAFQKRPQKRPAHGKSTEAEPMTPDDVAEIEVLSIDRQRNSAEYRLINRTDRPMTGCSLSITTVYFDGQTTQMDLRIDYVWSVELDPKLVPTSRLHEDGALWPGQEHLDQIGFVTLEDREKEDVMSVELDLNAVLFADRSAVGDSAEIEMMLDNRAGFRDSLEFWLERFERDEERHPDDAQATLKQWKQTLKHSSRSVGGKSPHYYWGYQNATNHLKRMLREGLHRNPSVGFKRREDPKGDAEIHRDAILSIFTRHYHQLRRHSWVHKKQ